MANGYRLLDQRQPLLGLTTNDQRLMANSQRQKAGKIAHLGDFSYFGKPQTIIL